MCPVSHLQRGALSLSGIAGLCAKLCRAEINKSGNGAGSGEVYLQSAPENVSEGEVLRGAKDEPSALEEAPEEEVDESQPNVEMEDQEGSQAQSPDAGQVILQGTSRLEDAQDVEPADSTQEGGTEVSGTCKSGMIPPMVDSAVQGRVRESQQVGKVKKGGRCSR